MATTERDILEGKVLPELQAIASSMGVQGYQRLRKADLIGAIIAKAQGVEFTPSSSPSAVVQRHRLVGMELRRLRDESGFTIDEVASKVDLSPSTISRMENGLVGVRTSDLRIFLDIYQASNTKRDELLQIVRPRRPSGQQGSGDYIYSETVNLLLEQVGQDETREVLTFLGGNRHRPPDELTAVVHQRFGREVADTILTLQELSGSLIEFLLVAGERLNLDLFSPVTQPMIAELERSARVLLADGKYDKARAALHRIVDLDPGLGREPNGRELLKQRLSEVGVTVSSWRSLVSKHNALVILDGFDEMSVKLDPDTLTGNIRKLVDCYEEFQGCKVLITSRTRVFENARDQARLLDRIGSPQTILIAQISRRRRLEYLDEFAVQVGAREQLLELRRLYDPIGLAAKPLFLQMIKDTLQELPSQDFNEIILYETYIRKSLRRKAADLDDDDLLILREELLENLLIILERIAVTLHISGNDFAYLRDFGDPSGGRNLAELLWRISDTAANTARSRSAGEDATARVGVRSLLKFVPAPDPDRWPVDFFHRSMREFFVARAIVRDLSGFDKSAGAREPLAASPLPPEIVNFAVGLMREQEKGDDPPPFEAELLGLAKGAVRGGRCRSVGGNALSLLYALRRSLPKSDFSGLDLDFADLSGADLGGMRFAGSSMRYANLDNANLENADFSDTDILSRSQVS